MSGFNISCNFGKTKDHYIFNLLQEFDKNPFSAEINNEIGKALFKTGDFKNAKAYFRKSLSLKHDWDVPSVYLKKIQSIEFKNDNYKTENKSEFDSIYCCYKEPQRILFIGDYLYPPVGGAEKSMLTILQKLNNDGHQCFAACYGPNQPITYKGISILPFDFSKIESIIMQVKPSIILSQLFLAEFAIKYSKKHHIPSILFIRSFEYFCHSPVNFNHCDKNCSQCKFHPFNPKIKDRYKQMIEDAGEVICNSEFMRKILKEFYGRDSKVIYPSVLTDEHIASHSTNEFIIMNQPEKHKGSNIFFEIAKRMSHLKFMTVGRGEKSNLSNCINFGQTDPLIFFGHAKLLLVPSIWPEPFGRIVLESFANGIPVIASKIGGLPEIVGDAGILIDDYLSINTWVEKINSLLNNSALYNELSLKARKRSINFHYNIQHKKLIPVINSLLEISPESSDRRLLDFYNYRYAQVATYNFLLTQRRERLEGLCNMVNPGESYCDIGCADGAHMEILSKRSIKGIGIDLSIPNIIRGSNVFPKNVFIHGYAENLPLVDNIVDVAIMGDILEHLRNPEEALIEAFRICSHGLVICVPIGKKTAEHIHPYPSIDSVESLFNELQVSLKWYNQSGEPIKKKDIKITESKPWVFVRAEKDKGLKFDNSIINKRTKKQGYVRDEWIERIIARDPQEINRFYATASIIKGPLVLEIASGNGDLSMKIAQKGYNHFGIDIMESGINWAKKTSTMRGLEKFTEFSVSNATQTNFPDNFFDSVIIPEMIEHIRDPHLIILEAIRVAKPGGKIIISVPDGPDSNPDHIRCFFKSTLKAELAQYTKEITWYNLPFKRWLIASFIKTDKMPYSGREAFHNIFHIHETEKDAPVPETPPFGFNIIGPVNKGTQQAVIIRSFIKEVIKFGYPVSFYDIQTKGDFNIKTDLPDIPLQKNCEMPYAVSLFFMDQVFIEKLIASPPTWLRLKNRLNIIIPFGKNILTENIDKYSYRKMDVIGVNSNHLSEYYKKKLPKYDTFFLPVPVNCHDQYVFDRSFFQLPEDCLIITAFFESDFSLTQQNFDLLISAFKLLPSDTNVMLIIVLEKTINKSSQQKSYILNKICSDSRIRLYDGIIGEEKTQALFMCCDVGCYFGPSFIKPLWLYEMMACGKTAFTSTSNIDEIINENTACIVESNVNTDGTTVLDEKIFYEKLKWYINNKSKLSEIGRKGKSVIEKQNQVISSRKMMDTIEFIHKALNKKRHQFTISTKGYQKELSKLRVLFQNRPDMFEHPGGDTQVLHAIRNELIKQGIEVDISTDPFENLDRYDIVHVFNSTTPKYTDAFASNAFKQGKHLAITPFQEDFPRYLKRSILFFNLLKQYIDLGQPQGLFEQIADNLSFDSNGAYVISPYAISGAGVVFTSGNEENKTIKKYFPKARTMITPFGTEFIKIDSDKSLFKETFGIKDFVLCVGRLEMRKNQLMLLKALENDPVTLVFACGGVEYQPIYASYCKKFKRKAPTLFLDRLDRNMLLSAFQSCRVHVLPSWYELPGLVTIEAAAHNNNVVASSWGTIKDYVGDDIYYCEPDNVESIRNAVLSALDTPPSNTLMKKVQNFSWENSAKTVIDGYKNLIENGNSNDPVERSSYVPSNISKGEQDHSIYERITGLVELGKIKEAIVLYQIIKPEINGLSEFKKFDSIMKSLQEKIYSNK